jgi:DNA-binding NtrC family response regulator
MTKPVILLIDDDKGMLNSLMDQLRIPFKEGFLIEAAQSTAEALDLIDYYQQQQISIPIVISDWLMPPDRTNDMLVKIYQKMPKTKIIMLSGYADDAAVEHTRKFANLYAFIRKPWEEKEIIDTIKLAMATA